MNFLLAILRYILFRFRGFYRILVVLDDPEGFQQPLSDYRWFYWPGLAVTLRNNLINYIYLKIFSLKNIGATCYMNSILQCLLNIDPFRYDLMVTNAELITSPLLEENTIYL